MIKTGNTNDANDERRPTSEQNYTVVQNLVKHMLHLQSKGLYEFNLNIRCPLTKDVVSLINDWITSKSSNLKHLTIQAVEIDERAMEEFTKSSIF